MNSHTAPAETCRYIHTPSAFARKNLLYVQEAGRLKSRDRHISKRSQLESCLFFIVLSGRGTVTLDGKPFSLDAGDHIFLDCRRPYAHESSDDEPWELLWVHFYGSAMEGYLEYFIKSQRPHIFRPAESSLFKVLLEQLLEQEQMRLTDRELMENELLHRLVTRLLTCRMSHAPTTNSALLKLQEIRRYLDEHYTEKLSLDKLANQFYISKYHMSREFKKAFGTTLVGYLTARRITKAKEMLRFTDMQIEAIAADCGIEDNSYFNKVFQKAEGITPREYRRKWRGQ